MQTITLSQLEEHLAQVLEVNKFGDYCENGVQVVGHEKVRKIAFAVTASQATINEAARLGVQALIVHHGLFWNKEKALLDRRKCERLKPLLERNISLLAYHLPLDAHPQIGNNWKAASDLGWHDLQPFGLSNGTALGVKGRFAPIEVEHFIAQLESYFRHKATVALFGKKTIQSAGFISGGAYSYLPQAAEEELDIFITGNFDEPAWWIAQEEKIHFAALGHYATETTGICALQGYIERTFGLETHFIDASNPF